MDTTEETMRQRMQARLESLKAEYEKGQQQLRQLESLRETMLRISGAITVLEELLAVTPAGEAGHRNTKSILTES